MALNPFSENKIEKASSYQMGRERIPIKRMPSAKNNMMMSLFLGFSKKWGIAKFYPILDSEFESKKRHITVALFVDIYSPK